MILYLHSSVTLVCWKCSHGNLLGRVHDALVTTADAGGKGTGGQLPGIGYLPFHHQAEGLVGAFYKADCLLPVATQGNLIDVDKLVPHLETHSCCLAALFYLEHNHSRRKTGNQKLFLIETKIFEKASEPARVATIEDIVALPCKQYFTFYYI